MGYHINVNCAVLLETANAVDQYVDTHERCMAMGTRAMSDLSGHWQGKDANQYAVQWLRITDEASVSTRMLQALRQYSALLRNAVRLYRDAQETAISAARDIPVL